MNLYENIQRIKEMMGILIESVKDVESILSSGSKGSEVEIIQDILGIYKDGKFGPQTKKCVQEFQNKVSIKDDGIVGDETKTKLKKLEDNEIEWETPEFCKTLENFKSYNSDSDSKEEKEKETIKSTEVNDSSLKKYNFHKIPMGTNNYRSAQIPIDLLESVIKKYDIKNIIRLNGDTGNDGKHISSDSTVKIQDEKKVCEDNDCKFYKISSHEGYEKGKGYQKSIKKVISILNEGNTLIHCAHGADRTGGLVGSYLKEKGYGNSEKIWNYTTQYNSWKKMSNQKFYKGYHKYAEGFISSDELKKFKKK